MNLLVAGILMIVPFIALAALAVVLVAAVWLIALEVKHSASVRAEETVEQVEAPAEVYVPQVAVEQAA